MIIYSLNVKIVEYHVYVIKIKGAIWVFWTYSNTK